jgi:hypothetical protein
VWAGLSRYSDVGWSDIAGPFELDKIWGYN